MPIHKCFFLHCALCEPLLSRGFPRGMNSQGCNTINLLTMVTPIRSTHNYADINTIYLPPGPVINVSTKMDVLNNLPAKMREEVMEFVMEVEGLNYIRDIGKGIMMKIPTMPLLHNIGSCLQTKKSWRNHKYLW